MFPDTFVAGAAHPDRYPFFYFWINPEYSKTFFCYSRSLFDQLHLISKPFMV